jgi:hypothetical protein
MDITTQMLEFWCEEHQTHLQPTDDAIASDSVHRIGELVVVSQAVNTLGQRINAYEFDLSGMECPTGDYAYAEDDCIKSWKVRTVE